MKKITVLIALMFSCTNEERTTSTLEGQGFTDIRTTGHAWNRCSESDDTCTGFTAIGPTGKHVSGAVGCGHNGCSKGCTVRFD